jgi:glycosyltransferase involved in cell wall biosynthesis
MHKVPYDEVGKVYADCDILIKSSILESFSYPPLEMMATGGLVVVAPNEGNIEYLKDEYNCLFYQHGDIEQAVNQINRLVSDKELREKLIKNGKETVKSREWEIIEKDIVNLYKEENIK